MLYQAGRTASLVDEVCPQSRFRRDFSNSDVLVVVVSVVSGFFSGETTVGSAVVCYIFARSSRRMLFCRSVPAVGGVVGFLKRDGKSASIRSFRHFFASGGTISFQWVIGGYGLLSVDL